MGTQVRAVLVGGRRHRGSFRSGWVDRGEADAPGAGRGTAPKAWAVEPAPARLAEAPPRAGNAP